MTNLNKLKAYYPSMPEVDVLDWLLTNVLPPYTEIQTTGKEYVAEVFGYLSHTYTEEDKTPKLAAVALTLTLIETGHIKPERKADE